MPFVFLVITTLFLSVGWFMDRYLFPKNLGFISGVLLWGFVCLVNWKRKVRFFIDFLSIAFTIFMGYLFVRSLFIPQYIQCVYIGTSWILFVLLRNKRIPAEVFISIFSVAGILQVMYGVLQCIGYMRSSSYFPILGSFNNPAGFAVSIVLCYPFLLYWNTIGKRKILKLFICLFLTVVAVLSGSRTSVLALFVITFLFYTIHYRESINKRRILLMGGGVLILTILFIGLIYLKPASVSGRMLIWKTSVGLCSKHILWGNGVGSFKKDYMLAQADYLSSSRVSNTERQLAGDTNHPFNEYLLLLIELGVVGVVLLLFLLFIIFRCKTSFDSPEFLALIGIAVFSCFSYPFKYAFVWLVAIYCLSSLAKKEFVLRKIDTNILFSFAFFVFLCIMCIFTIRMVMFEREWKQVASMLEGNVGLLDKELSVYDRLNDTWNGNPYFLYNYGAELNKTELYEKSIEIFLCCESYINTYNLQMQLADNYYHLAHWIEGEYHYKKALAMCPNRFLPLQGLLRLYMKSGDFICANQIALEILEKPIKIPSYTVSVIREEAKNYLSNNSISNKTVQ